MHYCNVPCINVRPTVQSAADYRIGYAQLDEEWRGCCGGLLLGNSGLVNLRIGVLRRRRVRATDCSRLPDTANGGISQTSGLRIKFPSFSRTVKGGGAADNFESATWTGRRREPMGGGFARAQRGRVSS